MNINTKPAIVVVAYNRPNSLNRLLASLASAEYPRGVTLIISIEGGASADVVEIAHSFICGDLNIQIIQHSERLGLREHIIACAGLSEAFGAVIILEDDLIVDRYFYKYVVQALSFYENEARVAGIALYSYEINEMASIPFKPMYNGYDTYPMQVPCSSGQCWTHRQWLDFLSWYRDKTSADVESFFMIPEVAKSWPESSWKKYFFAYMVALNKVFIYPYRATSTNVSDFGGAHIKSGSNVHQVSMPTTQRGTPNFRFAPVSHQEVMYDAFMEPCGEFVYRSLGLSQADVEIDIQGIKPRAILATKKYAVTKRKSTKKICLFSLSFRPPELNLAYPSPGELGDFWLSKTIDIIFSKRSARTVSELSYYAGFEIASRENLVAIIKTVAKKIADKVKKFFLL